MPRRPRQQPQSEISEREQQRREQQRRRSLDTQFPLRIYRTRRLAEIFDVTRETIWRWRQQGVLPPFVRFGGIEGLTGKQLQELFDQRQDEAAR